MRNIIRIRLTASQGGLASMDLVPYDIQIVKLIFSPIHKLHLCPNLVYLFGNQVYCTC
jgi:hypothetical protein